MNNPITELMREIQITVNLVKKDLNRQKRLNAKMAEHLRKMQQENQLLSYRMAEQEEQLLDYRQAEQEDGQQNG